MGQKWVARVGASDKFPYYRGGQETLAKTSNLDYARKFDSRTEAQTVLGKAGIANFVLVLLEEEEQNGQGNTGIC